MDQTETSICIIPGAKTFGRLAISERTVAPSPKPMIRRSDESDVVVYVLDGMFEIRFGRHAAQGRSGNAFLVPRGFELEYRNVLELSSRLLLIETPCGNESYYDRSPAAVADPSQIPESAFTNEVEPKC